MESVPNQHPHLVTGQVMRNVYTLGEYSSSCTVSAQDTERLPMNGFRGPWQPRVPLLTLSRHTGTQYINQAPSGDVAPLPPSINTTTTKRRSTKAPTTKPQSTQAPTTHPPSTQAPITQPPSTQAPTTQHPSGYTATLLKQTPITLPPSSYAVTQSAQAPTALLPSSYGPTTHHPSGEPESIPSDHDDDSVHVEVEIQPGRATDHLTEQQRGDAPSEQHEGCTTEEECQRELQKLFVHLIRVIVSQQKILASSFGVLQMGNKKTRAARLFVVISGMIERQKLSAADVLREKGNEKGKDLDSEFHSTVAKWTSKNEATVVPPIAELEDETGICQHPRSQQQLQQSDNESDDSTVEEQENVPSRENISLEEFARLMTIFRDVPEAAQDLLRSGHDLQRQELDLHTNRHAFWTNRIEPLFNDPTVTTSELFGGILQEIDPGRPVTTFRSGTCLQNLFNNFRKDFTLTHKNWAVSGNLDAASFIDFCQSRSGV